jgi:hypothetical protein
MIRTALTTALALIASTAVAAQEVVIPVEDMTPRPLISRIDAADLATTSVGIALGAAEANPIIGFAGDAAAPLVAIGVKAAAKHVMIRSGVPPKVADYRIGVGSAFGAGNNIAVIAGVGGPVGVAMGALVAAAYADMNRPGAEKDKTPRWERWHNHEGR